MPSYYAHFQFGKNIVRKMPSDLKAIINTNIDSIDAFIVGLQGPDPLYFHKPLFFTLLNYEAGEIHHSRGLDFFTPACNYLREHDSPEAKSYVLGSVAHYVLDASCHPIIVEHQKKEGISHRKVEREFDDFVMRTNGINPIHVDLNLLLPLNKNLGMICSPFYSTADPKLFNLSIADMRTTIGRLSSKSAFLRYAEYTVLSIIPPIKTVRDMIPMKKSAGQLTDEYYERNRLIYEEFINATSEAIDLMRETLSCIESGGSLSQRFTPNYLGKMP